MAVFLRSLQKGAGAQATVGPTCPHPGWGVYLGARGRTGCGWDGALCLALLGEPGVVKEGFQRKG